MSENPFNNAPMDTSAALRPEMDGGRLEHFQALYGESLQQQAQQMPEVASREEELRATGTELMVNFPELIHDDLFHDEGQALVFTALAGYMADPASSEQGMQMDKLGIASNTLKLLQPNAMVADAGEAEVTGHMTVALDRFRNTDLEQGLAEAVDDGLLDGIKQRMGITDENEEPFEFRVLDIDPGEVTSFGLGDTHRESIAGNTEELAMDLGMTEFTNEAWMQPLPDGSKLLCVSSPFVKKILDATLTEYHSEYTVAQRKNDFATLGHEYAHTQGGASAGNQVGIGLEELRVQHFANDNEAYFDTRNFIADIKVATGFDLDAHFASHTKGGTAAETYQTLVNSLGMDTAFEVIMAAPKAYRRDMVNAFEAEDNPGHLLQARNYRDMGGYDGIITRALDKQIAAGHGDEVEARLTERTELLISKIGIDNFDTLANDRRNLGCTVITDLMTTKVKELQAAPA